MTLLFDDRVFRSAVFARLAALTERHGDVLTWSLLKQGVVVRDRTVHVLGRQGNFTPAGTQTPISITTAPEKPGHPRPYDDDVGDDAMLRYRYRGTDPDHRDNVGLRRAFADATPPHSSWHPRGRSGAVGGSGAEPPPGRRAARRDHPVLASGICVRVPRSGIARGSWPGGADPRAVRIALELGRIDWWRRPR